MPVGDDGEPGVRSFPVAKEIPKRFARHDVAVELVLRQRRIAAGDGDMRGVRVIDFDLFRKEELKRNEIDAESIRFSIRRSCLQAAFSP